LTERRRVLVLGLDGLSHDLIREFAAKGSMPNFGRAIERFQLVRFDSILPTVSNVAWSCFATARNPGSFGVYGFTELTREMELVVPDSTWLKGETIWEVLARAGKRVVGVSVPNTHPPRRVDGATLVSCFLADRMSPATITPASEYVRFSTVGYEIDVDPTVAWRDRGQFVADLERVFESRRRLMKSYLRRSDWDLFVLHVMDTDRICHFLLKDYREGTAPFAGVFEEFFRRVDVMVGEALDGLPADCELMILSDHGFCPVRREFQVNRYLVREGFLSVGPEVESRGFAAIADRSRAFSLVPGRLYAMRAGRWACGGVSEEALPALLEDLTRRFLSVRDPETGEAVIERVYRAAEIYSGGEVSRSPDLVLKPRDGYDLKAMLSPGDLFTSSPVTGMHTFDDAHLLYSRPFAAEPGASIVDAPGLLF
jgi:predicted AlkP superfamily phosphohydrolase/phosphomutase